MSDRVFGSSSAATGLDGAIAKAVRQSLCHLPGVDDAGASYLVNVLSDISILSLMALSSYVLLLSGRVSFGQQAYFALGAYLSGIGTVLFGWSLPQALVLGVLCGSLGSYLLARLTVSLSGLYYAVGTLAFAEMLRLSLSSWHWQIDKGEGPVGPAGLEGFRSIRWLYENNIAPEVYLLVCLAILACVLLGLMAMERCRLGLNIRMIGHDESLALAQGIPVNQLRLTAAAIAGALAATAGGLYAHRTTYVEAAVFDPMLGVHALGYALLGGLGTALGPILGVVLDLGLLDASRLVDGWRMVIFGGLIAVILKVRPRGLLDEPLVNRIQGVLRQINTRPYTRPYTRPHSISKPQ
jgi:branched-chain amino acid transport system permease protein